MHSQSPIIQQLFAQSVGMHWRYERLRVPQTSFTYTLNTLTHLGLQGCNITVPFKLAAFDFANSHSPRALEAQAVNFLKRQNDGSWWADNTDGAGLVADLQRLLGGAGSLSGARVLILGAGGAVQGCLTPLLAAGAIVHVANRTLDKAIILAQRFMITPHTLLEPVPACDVIVNATSSSLKAQPLLPNLGAIRRTGTPTLAYDMMYAQQPTLFMQACAKQGARTVDGLGMLIEQAAESFYLWHNIMPDTSSVHRALAAKTVQLSLNKLN